MMGSVTQGMAAPPDHQIRRYAAWRRRGRGARASEMAWLVEPGEADEAPQFILPHGEPSLVLRLRGGAAALKVCGASREARAFDPEPGLGLAALQLTPERAAQLLGVDPASCLEWMTPPAALEDAAAPLLEAVAGKSSHEALHLLSAWFDALCAGDESEDRPDQRAMRLLRRTGGRIAMSELAEQVGACERGLRRRFRDEIGLTPKAYARQIRLSAAMVAADGAAKPRWAELAAAHGYFDQAHLIAEARALTGLTPSALLARRSACPKSPIAAQAA